MFGQYTDREVAKGIRLKESILSREEAKGIKLKDNEYFALMVEDKKRGYSDNRKFLDELMGWLGLECTSERRVYISKDFFKRWNPHRGTTYIVAVDNPELHCELNY
jgi:hypothetical protein